MKAQPNNDTDSNAGTLISVGFMPLKFKRLFDVLLPIVELLPRPIRIQAGDIGVHPVFDLADTVVDFTSSEQMEKWTASASIIITHAGVGSIKLANKYRKLPIVIPRRQELREHIDNHQTELATKLTDLGLAVVIDTHNTEAKLHAAVISAQMKTCQPSGILQINTPKLQFGSSILAVSSVGGHRAELRNFVQDTPKEILRLVTDEMCDEVRNGTVARFPSCNKRKHLPLRALQAFWYLLRRPDIDTIITTGAGVGALFVLAGRILRRRTIAIESITRIQAPGLWFKLAGAIAHERYAYSWSKWARNRPNFIIIDVSVLPLTKDL